jgi:hypothetical protein
VTPIFCITTPDKVTLTFSAAMEETAFGFSKEDPPIWKYPSVFEI